MWSAMCVLDTNVGDAPAVIDLPSTKTTPSLKKLDFQEILHSVQLSEGKKKYQIFIFCVSNS